VLRRVEWLRLAVIMPLFAATLRVPCLVAMKIHAISFAAAALAIALGSAAPLLAQETDSVFDRPDALTSAAPSAAGTTSQAGEVIPGYTPITPSERLQWVVAGNLGPRSLGVGVLKASWDTAWNTPSEWNQSWSGFGKRFVNREVQVGISNSIEAGLGAVWGEDVRYFRSRRTGLWARTGYAAKTTFLAPRRNGQLAPAWAYYIGAVGNNLIANAWLPDSATGVGDTTWRISNGLLGRFAGNLWFEFWPDVRERIFERN
jgi:hypothetical protein